MAPLVNMDKPHKVTRKKRDLEATMNTLKKLLEPTKAVTNKRGTRKKRKPRSLPKPAPKRSISRLPSIDGTDDGEYYPNLKKKDRTKKIVLKPKHDLKLIIATNKRKQRTPQKGLESYTDGENMQVPPGLGLSRVAGLEVHTPPPSSNSEITYDLISPPHKSLTKLTMDDLMRMDEDSLSDEDLMEVLTCPSPVWWEDPPDDVKDALYLTETEDNSPTDTNSSSTEGKNSTNPNSSIELKLKRTGIISEIRNKTSKIAKLENILGNIKSRMQFDKTIDESLEYNGNDISSELESSSSDSRDVNRMFRNNDVRGINKSIGKKHRTVSSCSDISINEEELLRNLECIDIPIQKMKTGVQMDKEDKNNDEKNDKNNVDDDFRNIPGDDESLENEFIMDDTEKITADLDCVDNVNVTEKQPKLKATKRNNVINKDVSSTEYAAEINKTEKIELKHKECLRRLSKSDDILDVRIIKTPTNKSNEVKIWSQLDNFKIHNFQPDFDDVIDVENVLEYSMIQSPGQNRRSLLASKTDTILIDDDSNDEDKESSNVNEKNNIDVTNNAAIEKDPTHYELAEITPLKTTDTDKSKDIVKNDTRKTSNDSNVKLYSKGKQKVTPKPIRNKQNAIKYNYTPTKSYSILKSNNIKKNKSAKGIKILPIQRSETISLQPNQICINTKPIPLKIKYSDDKTNDNAKNKINGILEQQITDIKIPDKVIRINDVDITLVKNPGAIKENANAIKPVAMNDLSITLINNKPNVTLKAPKILPSLTKNPKPTFESPKSVNNFSETTDYTEGTISDSNIQFLDEYEEKSPEKIVIVRDLILNMNQDKITDNKIRIDVNPDKKIKDVKDKTRTKMISILLKDANDDLDKNVIENRRNIDMVNITVANVDRKMQDNSFQNDKRNTGETNNADIELFDDETIYNAEGSSINVSDDTNRFNYLVHEIKK